MSNAMRKVSRPDVFDKEAVVEHFEKSEGSSRKDAQTTLSCMRLLIPVVLASLDDEELVELIKKRSADFGLVADDFWEHEVPRIMRWARHELEEYRRRRQG